MLLLLLACSLLDPLTTKIGNTVFLTGTFVQTETWALTRESEVTRGVMGLAHPNLFRLSFTDPEGRVTGCDGSSVFTVEPLYREVVIYDGASPEGFLHLLNRAREEGMPIQEDIQGDRVTLTVTGDLGGGISSLVVTYSAADSLPRQFATLDVNGNRTEWSFTGLSSQGSWPSGYFDLAVPDGYSVLAGER